MDHRYFPDLLDDVEVVQVDGDAEIVDGIRVLLTPGHTVGGQTVVVNTGPGKAVITGFCCNEENFPATGPRVLRGFTSTSSTPTRAPDGSRRWQTSSSPCTTWRWAGSATSPPERGYQSMKFFSKALPLLLVLLLSGMTALWAQSRFVPPWAADLAPRWAPVPQVPGVFMRQILAMTSSATAKGSTFTRMAAGIGVNTSTAPGR